MFPIILRPENNSMLVIGNGAATARRIRLLEDAGMKFTHLLTPIEWKAQGGQQTDPALSVGEANSPLREKEASAGAKQIVFIADFDEKTSAELYHRFKAQGALVNVEDKTHLCDFHVPAIVRRGDLLITVSTNAASPRLARRLRMMLEQLFPSVWAERLNLISQKRNEWKAQGVSFSEIADKTDALLDGEGWLQANCECLRRSKS